ncbi:MFS transporter [Altericroceibacterium spongiae]|uniref:MFS transporter n=1 Tax=Altericroceibacterium spongiae TaxID=2320269 RepID=A0A420EFJ9_9SPHN|nr:MFS transporter [Altericroceibacterium spongiae]RKF19448.1 MFS transporter [Altericroceibacterium spongiae]
MKINLPLLALATGAFGIGVAEFSPMGLLSLIADDLDVSIPAAGLLISAYAIGVMAGAPLMTLTTGRIRRRSLLIGLAAIFTFGNVLAALSENYNMLMMARVVTSLNHGAFFGVGSVVAASVVPPGRGASAVAAMFMGLTIANVVGVPLATWTGEQFGWRSAFWGISLLGFVTMAALRLTLPDRPVPENGGALAELRVLGRKQVLAALSLTGLGASAMFAVYTYIAPILEVGAGASIGFVTSMLIVYGLGLTVGNWLGGRYADRSVDCTLMAALAGMAIVLVVFAWLMAFTIPAIFLIFLWGVASFAIVPPLQVRVMEAAKDAPNLASAVNIGAFNLGNAVGAALGGAVIAAGFGYRAVPLAGAVMAILALACVALASRSPQGSTAEPLPGQ